MLPGKRDFYRCCKARRSASHVNKEFWQQFQNYAPPSLRVIRTKFACTIYIYIYIRDSQLNRPESVSLASLARQLHGSGMVNGYVATDTVVPRREYPM